MKTIQTIFEKGDHKWFVISRDPNRPNDLIDTNEYLVVNGMDALMTDPGGSEIFPAVFSALATKFNPAGITALFASHQDPDIISSLSLWLDFKPTLKCYVSWLWASFIPHFGGRADTFIQIPDPGLSIKLGGLTLEAVPAHFLHSSGNFHLHDPVARMYFSGDVGAALLPPGETGCFVTDFDRHVRFAEAFTGAGWARYRPSGIGVNAPPSFPSTCCAPSTGPSTRARTSSGSSTGSTSSRSG